MEQLAQDIWIFNGAPVRFLGLPFSTRMTVVRLPNNELWVHSPIQLSPDRKEQMDSLGRVKYLIAPNHLHHLFLAEWITAYPDATCFGTDEVIKKRDDIAFDVSLNQVQSWPWSDEIEQELFSGSSLMQECIFFHKASSTLIVTDLVENFSGHDFNCFQRVIGKGVGIMAPNGKTPLDWRLSFMFHKADARRHFYRMLNWEPQILVMAHGEIIKENTSQFLVRSFKWLV